MRVVLEDTRSGCLVRVLLQPHLGRVRVRVRVRVGVRVRVKVEW